MSKVYFVNHKGEVCYHKHVNFAKKRKWDTYEVNVETGVETYCGSMCPPKDKHISVAQHNRDFERYVQMMIEQVKPYEVKLS